MEEACTTETSHCFLSGIVEFNVLGFSWTRAWRDASVPSLVFVDISKHDGCQQCNFNCALPFIIPHIRSLAVAPEAVSCLC